MDKAAEAVPVEYATFQAFLVRKYFVKGINYLDERYGDSWSDAGAVLSDPPGRAKDAGSAASDGALHPQVRLIPSPPRPSWRPTASTARRYFSASTMAS